MLYKWIYERMYIRRGNTKYTCNSAEDISK